MENDQVGPIVLLYDLKTLTMCRVSSSISMFLANVPLPVRTQLVSNLSTIIWRFTNRSINHL